MGDSRCVWPGCIGFTSEIWSKAIHLNESFHLIGRHFHDLMQGYDDAMVCSFVSFRGDPAIGTGGGGLR
jgi:hypothetical protein